MTLGDAEQQQLITEIIWLWVLLCCLKLIINCTYEIAVSNIILGLHFLANLIWLCLINWVCFYILYKLIGAVIKLILSALRTNVFLL